MYNNIKPIVPGFGTSQVRPEYSPKYVQRILKRCGIPGFTCQTARLTRGDLLGFLAHAVKMTLRAGMFTPMAKVSVANRIFLHQCRTFHKQDKKLRKNHGKTPLPKVWWGSILKQIEIEVQLALNWQSWHKPSGEHDLNCLARRKRASVAEAMRFKKQASTGVPGYPREDATCQGRPTVLSRYHHTSFNNPAILYHEALRK